ncbi:hypothetical protein, partial [Planococcus wigleyi]
LMQIESFRSLGALVFGLIAFGLLIIFFFWDDKGKSIKWALKILANIFLLWFVYKLIFKFIKVSSRETMKAVNRGSRKAAASVGTKDYKSEFDWEQSVKPKMQRFGSNILILTIILVVIGGIVFAGFMIF